MKHLLILNDPPYGSERSYNDNALRLARKVAACGTCMDARGTMDLLTEWTAWADKVLVF